MKSESNNIIHSSNAPAPVGLYPHARRVGNLLFLSGVGPRERGTTRIPGVELDAAGNIVSHDIEKQCHSVFKNVKAILEDAGSGWDKIVDVTVFLTNMKKDFPIYNKIYAEYFKDNQPCRTTVEVSALPTPIAIELKVIATLNPEFAAGGRRVRPSKLKKTANQKTKRPFAKKGSGFRNQKQRRLYGTSTPYQLQILDR